MKNGILEKLPLHQKVGTFKKMGQEWHWVRVWAAVYDYPDVKIAEAVSLFPGVWEE